MKRTLYFFLVFLTACSSTRTLQGTSSTPVSFFDRRASPANLNPASTSGQIQQAMLHSAESWKTVQMAGDITWFAKGEPVQSFTEQVWLDPIHSRYKVNLTGISNSTEKFIKLSDGVTVHNIHLSSNQDQTFPYPDSARVGQYVPPLTEGEAHPNPMWAQIGTPLSQLAFPSDYAQNTGIFKALGVDVVAGRASLIVEWKYAENSQPSWKLWLDTQTGLILKLQEYSRDGSGVLTGERVVTAIMFDGIMDASLFGLPADSSPAGATPQMQAGPPIGESVITPAGEAGELYFFLQPRKTGQSIRLAKVSGVCVYDPPNCPPLEIVKVPFAFDFTITAMSWSPDGKLAAFAYSDHPMGTPTKLWLFDPSAETWTALAEFPYIDPPFWSPDGSWIAFRTQDGQGGEDVQAIHRDGSELKRVSAKLPAEGRPYIMDGWYGENILMRSALPGHEGSIYLVHANDGVVRPMLNALAVKAPFVISPDASLLAFDDQDPANQNQVLKVMGPDGANPVSLANFSGGSIYPFVWSPDSQLIAFNYYRGFSAGEPKAEVYVVGRDGTNLSLVYSGVTIGHLIFSPNGHYLLVEETTSSTGGHLFMVNLGTFKKSLLQAPQLSTEYDWYAPSWRP